MGVLEYLKKFLPRGSTRPHGHPGTSEWMVAAGRGYFPTYGTPGPRAYERVVSEVSIVATGVRAFLDLVGSAEWAFASAEADGDGRYAELAQQALTSDPATKWRSVVQRAALYRFYGFSLHEWVARRRPDGVVTFADISPRPQGSVERWEVRPDGSLAGVTQSTPVGRSAFIPRTRLLHVVDDALTTHPAGFGVLRHAMSDVERLAVYSKLEQHGFYSDLRGVPVGRAPLSLLQDAVRTNTMTEAQRAKALEPMRQFLNNEFKGPRLGLLLDSLTYASKGENARPSGMPLWDFNVMRSDAATAYTEVAEAIQRVTRNIAQLLGIEHIMLGTNGGGSYALASEQADSLHLQVNAVLDHLTESVVADLVWRLWQLNGWPEDVMPTVAVEHVQHRRVTDVTKALYDVARAGAPLSPDDPAVRDVRDMLGLAFGRRAGVGGAAAAEGHERGVVDETRARG